MGFKALYVEKSGDIVAKTVAEPYKPENDQSLVRVRYSSINPADYRHFKMGMDSYFLGHDYAGTVEAVGPSSSFKPGDEVFGMATPDPSKPDGSGSHQAYLLTEPWLTWARPSNLDTKIAAAIPAAAQTAIDALFNCMGYALPQAGLKGTDARGDVILIWGGSSAVGSAAIVMAKAAGFTSIYTTASPHNHNALIELGATKCFDYRSPSVVSDIRAAVAAQGIPLRAIFDSVSAGLGVYEGLTEEQEQEVQKDFDKSSAALARQCISDEVKPADVKLSTVLPVKLDPTWIFCLTPRLPKDDAKFPGYAERVHVAMKWLINNHETVWKPIKISVATTAEDGIKQIKRVYGGGASMEKVVIEHPMA